MLCTSVNKPRFHYLSIVCQLSNWHFHHFTAHCRIFSLFLPFFLRECEKILCFFFDKQRKLDCIPCVSQFVMHSQVMKLTKDTKEEVRHLNIVNSKHIVQTNIAYWTHTHSPANKNKSDELRVASRKFNKLNKWLGDDVLLF